MPTYYVPVSFYIEAPTVDDAACRIAEYLDDASQCVINARNITGVDVHDDKTFDIEPMTTYFVLFYTDAVRPADPPLVFSCEADDAFHAEEQCTNAYPYATVVWVADTETAEDAYADYWGFTASKAKEA